MIKLRRREKIPNTVRHNLKTYKLTNKGKHQLEIIRGSETFKYVLISNDKDKQL